MDTLTLTAEVGAVLSASGLREASRRPSGHPAGDGWLAEPMTQCGPGRVAVRWHRAVPCPEGPGAVLSTIAFRLATAGYLVEAVYATAGPYLAVLPRQAAGPPASAETGAETTSMTATASTPGSAVPARSGVHVCASPLCGSIASYPGTCCGQPMTPRGGRR
jgi:hypothetical protein